MAEADAATRRLGITDADKAHFLDEVALDLSGGDDAEDGGETDGTGEADRARPVPTGDGAGAWACQGGRA